MAGYEGGRQSGDGVVLAAKLARGTGARLLVAFVHHRDGRPERDGSPRPAVAVLHEQLQPIFDVLGPEHEPQLVALPAAGAAAGLQGLAEQKEAGLIVVGSSRRGRLGRVVAGSTGARLLMGAPCAVAVAPYAYATAGRCELGTIGVALDGTDSCEPALDEAVRLAERTGAELLAISARPRGAAFAGWEGDERVEELLARALVPDVERLVVTGRAASALAEAALAVDLLVTGSRGGGPAGRVVAGSVSLELMYSAPVPILVVPRGVRVPA